MKKRIVTIITCFLLSYSASFAGTRDTQVPESITSEFSNDFSTAKNVSWEKFDNYFRASFNQYGTVLYAFYTQDADFMGIGNNMLSSALPLSLQSGLSRDYTGYWITDLFRYALRDKSGYYITLENADQIKVLKSDGSQKWQLYKTIIKS